MENILWRARKRTLFGLPLSFTVYTLTDSKFYIKTGLLHIKEEEIRLYRFLDITLSRTLEERIFGLGSIHCCTADKTAPEFDIKRIKNPKEIRILLSDQVEEQRNARYVGVREFLDDESDGASTDH